MLLLSALPAPPLRRLRLARLRAAAGGGEPSAAEAELASKLAAAEEEAARLRAQLGADSEPLSRLRPAPLASGKRTDGQTARIGGVQSGASSWLSEGELSGFLAKLGPGEEGAAGDSGVSAEEKATLGRRLAIGAAATLAFFALSRVPDAALRSRSSKPLFLLLVPLVRAQAALPALRPLLADAQWEQLSAARRSQLPAGPLREALEEATGELPAGSAPEAQARAAATAFLEYLADTDYAAYFDSRITPTGTQAAEFSAFGLKALEAAEAQLRAFLALFPAEDVEGARSSIAASSAF